MRHLGTAAQLFGWIVVAILGLLAIARVVAWDTTFSPLLGLHGLGPLPFLLALPVALFARIGRDTRLALVALAVLFVAVPTGLPEFAAAEGKPLGARTAPSLRILTWNVYHSNADVAAIDKVVSDANADVVVLQEVSPSNVEAVGRSPALSAYRHSFTTPPSSAFGAGIWSRLPLEGAEEFQVGGLPMARATVVTAAGPVRVVNVHALSPVTDEGRDRWPRQLGALAELARSPGPPIVLAGDFNATWGHRPFRRLLDAGLEDAGAARGSRWSPTWPEGRRWVPPLLRIDHVLSGAGLDSTSYRTGDNGGSDHRSIVVDLSIQPVGG